MMSLFDEETIPVGLYHGVVRSSYRSAHVLKQLGSISSLLTHPDAVRLSKGPIGLLLYLWRNQTEHGLAWWLSLLKAVTC